MPLFEYLCAKCGHRFELLVFPGSTAEATCPNCSSTEVRKLISAFGIGGGASKFKGSSGSGCSCCSSKNCSTCK